VTVEKAAQGARQQSHKALLTATGTLYLGRKMISDNKKRAFQNAVAEIAKTRKDIVMGAIRGLLNDPNQVSSPKPSKKYDCFCYNCNKDRTVNGFPYAMTTMIVCPKCGNKRCPHATDHNLACTNSNVSGQTGSRY
jgi:ribosomal protein L32